MEKAKDVEVCEARPGDNKSQESNSNVAQDVSHKRFSTSKIELWAFYVYYIVSFSSSTYNIV
jgi:hypothetical protein